MYLTPDIIRAQEELYGVPVVAVAETVFSAREFALLEYCLGKNRAHDITLLIRDEPDRFAVIRKPSYPPEVFRPPSGGVEPGETLAAGAEREALEETGLEVRLERYLLRVEARFFCGDRIAPWVTHVFLAHPTGGTLAPRDLREIAEARWATVEELCGSYRQAMLAVGSEGMRYRVDLQDLSLESLGMAPLAEPPGGRVVRRKVA